MYKNIYFVRNSCYLSVSINVVSPVNVILSIYLNVVSFLKIKVQYTIYGNTVANSRRGIFTVAVVWQKQRGSFGGWCLSLGVGV